jgi:hypothetical protein
MVAGGTVQPNYWRCRAWDGSTSGGIERERRLRGFRFTAYLWRGAPESARFEAGRRRRQSARGRGEAALRDSRTSRSWKGLLSSPDSWYA